MKTYREIREGLKKTLEIVDERTPAFMAPDDAATIREAVTAADEVISSLQLDKGLTEHGHTV